MSKIFFLNMDLFSASSAPTVTLLTSPNFNYCVEFKLVSAKKYSFCTKNNESKLCLRGSSFAMKRCVKTQTVFIYEIIKRKLKRDRFTALRQVHCCWNSRWLLNCQIFRWPLVRPTIRPMKFRLHPGLRWLPASFWNWFCTASRLKWVAKWSTLHELFLWLRNSLGPCSRMEFLSNSFFFRM